MITLRAIAPRRSVANMSATIPAFIMSAMSGTWGLSQTSIEFSSSRRRPCLNGLPTMTSTMKPIWMRALACSKRIQTSFWPTLVLPLSTKKASSSPSNSRQEALSIQRLEGGIGRTSRALAIPLLPSTDFGRCSRVPAGGLTCLALSVVKSCSKRLSCPISPAVIARCSQNWLCLAVSGVRTSDCF